MAYVRVYVERYLCKWKKNFSNAIILTLNGVSSFMLEACSDKFSNFNLRQILLSQIAASARMLFITQEI